MEILKFLPESLDFIFLLKKVGNFFSKVGNKFNDTIEDNQGYNVVHGNGGNDTIDASDEIYGDDGDDTITGVTAQSMSEAETTL